MANDELNDDLYPVIPDTEYRGDGYFYGVVKDKKFSVRTEDPTTYGASIYGSEELLLRMRDKSSYWVYAVMRDGLWKTPRPTYETKKLHYVINADDLETIIPR